MARFINPQFSRQLTQTQAQAAFLIACIMLSVDTLNPIKLIAGAIGVSSNLFVSPFVILLLSLIVGQASDIAYFSVRIFFNSIVSIFFNRVEIIGSSNVPVEGPIIFTGNHANQFVDAIQVITTCGHKVGFIMAKKSFDKAVPGFFGRAMGCIPVTRPQDSAQKRPETEAISVVANKVTGVNTHFLTDLGDGDKIRFRGKSEQLKVKDILSDTELVLVEDVPSHLEELGNSRYDILKYVDQGKVFNYVHGALAHGKCLGIFPEGGSHDRTDLLPLKVGVAIIAFGTLEKHGVNVPVVPLGMSYFRGHRFRGRAVVEFGPSVRISEELFELYRKDKREAYAQFLMQIEEGMRACLVTAPDYESLRLVYMCRRLFQPDDKVPTPEQKQDMNRRFAEGYKILEKRYAEKGIPDDARQLRDRLEAYRLKLSSLGMRDYQVPTLESPNALRATYRVVHMFLVLLLASVPSLILNAPVGIVARIMAIQERKRALAGSVVKIAARDVMMSKKIMISVVMVPTLWLFYAILLFIFFDWTIPIKILFLLCFPVFSYAGVMATEAGMVDLKDIKPLLNRLRPSNRKMMDELPAERRALQKDLRAFVKQVGPELGPIYTEPDIKWGEMFRKQKGGMDAANGIATMAENAAKVMEESDPASMKKKD